VVGAAGEAIGINYVCAAEKQILLRARSRLRRPIDYCERSVETAIDRRCGSVRSTSRRRRRRVDFEVDLAARDE
jgi:CDP-glycerol glycerophosphotransferase